MIEKFRKYLADNQMLNPGDNILLAVSGGIDSMVMAHLFLSAEIKIGIAHCNFTLREKESDMDEELVRKYAKEHNLSFYAERFETKSFASDAGVSVQMAARELRYKWFEEIRLRNGYDYIAVAHNLNDNIETLLLNLTRGTGISGLTGMRPVNGSIIRPLLFATRSEITVYCKEKQLVFREDRSNADTKYTRNKIRHLVIPLLKEINPAIENTFSDTIERLTGTNEIVTLYISGLMERISVQSGNNFSFKYDHLKNYLSHRAIIFELFRQFGVSGSQLNDLSEVITGRTGGQLFTPTHRIVKNRKEIIVSPAVRETENTFIIDSVEGFNNVPQIESAELIRLPENYSIPADNSIACLDAEKLIFPLTIRKWEFGDHFYPLGMNQKKKLSDFFIDEKFSLPFKEKILVLESDGRITWIIGERIDDRFRIQSSTKEALIIKSIRNYK